MSRKKDIDAIVNLIPVEPTFVEIERLRRRLNRLSARKLRVLRAQLTPSRDRIPYHAIPTPFHLVVYVSLRTLTDTLRITRVTREILA